ncbi:hypothetical protein MN608_10424 [Microdochium nivale]|nr:hypothetical protein MN608_10424 [Microdochium nivale]
MSFSTEPFLLLLSLFIFTDMDDGQRWPPPRGTGVPLSQPPSLTGKVPDPILRSRQRSGQQAAWTGLTLHHPLLHTAGGDDGGADLNPPPPPVRHSRALNHEVAVWSVKLTSVLVSPNPPLLLRGRSSNY